MEITWYGHSCFRLIERGMASVVTDPYNHEHVGYSPLKLRSTIATISHEAEGHNYIDAIKPQPRVLNGPGEYEIGGVFITAVETNGKKRKDGEMRNLLFVFDFDSVNVAHLGDINRVPSQSQVEALGTVDVLLVPVGGGGGLNAAKAAEVVSLLEPGIVIPMHYETKAGKIQLDPLDKFLKEMGISEIETESSLKITKTSIPTETKVVVLNYASS